MAQMNLVVGRNSNNLKEQPKFVFFLGVLEEFAYRTFAQSFTQWLTRIHRYREI